MAMANMAEATRGAGVTVIAPHPGGVKVEKLAAYDLPDFMPTDKSVAAMIKVIGGLKPADSGRFLDWTGTPQPW